MKIKVKIDKLTLSTPIRYSDINCKYNDIPGFKPSKFVNTNNTIKEEKDFNVNKYENIIKYSSIKNNTSMIVCSKRKKEFNKISPVYILFYTDYFDEISYQEVFQVEQYFQQLNIPLRVSIIHLALDIIIKEKNDLYNKIILLLKPGFKGDPSKKYASSTYFGDLHSGNQLMVYDKTVQLLEKKNIEISEDVCRIELKLRMHRMNNYMPSIYTIQDLATYDWSFVYGRFYSFHHRCDWLKQEFKAKGMDCRKPIWELRDIMESKYEVYPSNFYRDYLIDHPILSPAVKQALSEFQWCDYNAI